MEPPLIKHSAVCQQGGRGTTSRRGHITCAGEGVSDRIVNLGEGAAKGVG
jgi:hypothetical protein